MADLNDPRDTHDFCFWCHRKVNLPRPLKAGEKALCSRGCWDAEQLFCAHFSDENVEVRNEAYKSRPQTEEDET